MRRAKLFGWIAGMSMLLGTTPSWSNGKTPIGYTLAPIGAVFYPSDPSVYRSHSVGYGILLDGLSSFTFNAKYSKEIKKAGTVAVELPITLDYGLAFGFLQFDRATAGGNASLFTVQPHIDFLRLISVGGGAYYAGLSNAPPGTHSGWGAFASARASIFPYSFVRPIVEGRAMFGRMAGKQIIFGFTIGQSP